MTIRSHSHAFGTHVRTLRDQRGLTHEQLSERCDLPADTIRRLEQGGFSPTLQTMRKLAGGLEVNLSSLFAAMEVSSRDAAGELMELIAGRDPNEIALVTEVVRTLLQQLDARR